MGSENYYPQVFLEECKYIVNEKERTNHTNEDLKIYSNSKESGKGQIKMISFLNWVNLCLPKYRSFITQTKRIYTKICPIFCF